MGKLIQDVTPVRTIRQVQTSTLVNELFRRGITIEQLFGMYYALEAITGHLDDELFGNDEDGQHGRQPITVGDAQLALGVQPIKYNQPFQGELHGEEIETRQC